jgi:hypothetical protein
MVENEIVSFCHCERVEDERGNLLRYVLDCFTSFAMTIKSVGRNDLCMVNESLLP